MAISMDRWRDKVAIVTGASAGIGAATATQLVEAGLKVVGLARRKEKLEDLSKALEGKPGKFYNLQADISKEEDVVQAFKWVKDNLGPVHILVNNAGLIRMTTLTGGDTKHWKEILDTNVLGLCVATREAVKDMKMNDVAGHIIHINSVAGHSIASGNLNMYGASKYAVTALTETLRQELNSVSSKIKITSISPGFVTTDIFEAGATGTGIPLPQEVKGFTETAPSLKAEDVADAIIYVLSTPAHVQVHELTIKPVGERF